ncbi:hypothetical protein C1H46_022358 [Malus baccata]|uniref:Uncharacterized protein n=1 Tax=Malus baccata TaxID=106549 RepID=A0A540LZY0_MALBA|nr:hypothetical protein C1H46_022358 [Malus baccata]
MVADTRKAERQKKQAKTASRLRAADPQIRILHIAGGCGARQVQQCCGGSVRSAGQIGVAGSSSAGWDLGCRFLRCYGCKRFGDGFSRWWFQTRRNWVRRKAAA